MVVLKNSALEHISLPSAHIPTIPSIDLSSPSSKYHVVRACEELGFFKVTNHGVSRELTARLEAEAVNFFNLPRDDKETAGPAEPFGYGNRKIGPNGDVGWLEYLLLDVTSNATSRSPPSFLHHPSATSLRCALEEYTSAVKKLACEILELIAQELRIEPRDALSKLLRDEESDLMLRLNHYPYPPRTDGANRSLTGFGEHTDPQIISVLRSNDTSGLEISARDASWIPVPPDQDSFFINVGDTLQVLTNGRFRSVKHRVMASGLKEARISMIFFGGPPSRERLAPLEQLIEEGEQSMYREFTWFEYKKSVYKSRLADNRLGRFEKV